ncbi:hypothetical protein BGZ98_003526, partial [Dissophora globulifera]
SGEWNVQMVISCRSESLSQDYRDRFQPSDNNRQASPELFQEAVIAPFSTDQVQEYIKKYVSTGTLWQVMDYLRALELIPNLQDLVKNPFLLTLTMEVLPRMVDPGQELTSVQVTRVALYDQFVEQWLERGKRRLADKDLSSQERKDFERLADDGFTLNGIGFLKDLACAIYKHQAGYPVVTYSHRQDQGTWKERYFSRKDENQLLLEACPLTRGGNQYRFIHKSILEYCLARAVFEPQDEKDAKRWVPTQTLTRRGSVHSVESFESQDIREESVPPIPIERAVLDSPLGWKFLVREPSIVQFLADRVQQEPIFKQQLLAAIELSKTDDKARKAAANAITILVRAGVRFIEEDLKGIRIPGADLSYGQFDSAQLQGADLRNVNLRNIWLRQANLSNARMSGVQFGEWPYLQENCAVSSCAFSSDGCTFVTGLVDGTISVYDTAAWVKILVLQGHTEGVSSVTYSPSGHQIASGSNDNTVRLWDVQNGASGLILRGHTGGVVSVTYSPNGHQIASGSDDNMVRLWDVQTGASGLILRGHTGSVVSVAYSPNGRQIASGSDDKTVRLWDVQTGAPSLILSGHTDKVWSIAYSPNGNQIASGSQDKTVRLWDAKFGSPGLILAGHTEEVWSVSYSPNGHQIASGGGDNAVWLWDVQTGASVGILSGHTNDVRSVAYSPNGHQIASGDAGGKVRLWDAQTSVPGVILSGLTARVRNVTYSPNGQQMASGSDDKTVRLWDAQTGAPGLILSGHTAGVVSVTYSPNGHQIASGGREKTVRLWDAKSGSPGPILSGHTDSVWSVTYSPNGHQIASGGEDMTVRLWDAKSGSPGLILEDHTRSVWSVTYSPNGNQIASGSDDKTVRLWDAKSGSPGLILSGHSMAIWTVAYLPNGHQIISGSLDETVRLWAVASGQCLVVVAHFGEGITSVASSAALSGLFFATGSGNSVRTLKVTEEEGQFQVHLLWSSAHSKLTVAGSLIQGTQGLSKINIQLLKQRGAAGDPTPPLSLYEVSRKITGMASIASKLKVSANIGTPREQ